MTQTKRHARTRYALLSVAALACGTLGSVGAVQAAVVYVSAGSAGPGHDGRAWCTAYTAVQPGIDAARAGDEVWVAAGTYPERLILKAGIALYGGFAGTETGRAQRDIRPHQAVLDGQAAGTTVSIPQGSDNVVVDGFTIRNGKAADGAGVAAFGNHVVLSNNQITANIGGGVASWAEIAIEHNVVSHNTGGGISVTSDPSIRDNLIVGNTAQYVGGGVRVDSWARLVLEGNTIVGNSAPYGGGLAFGPYGTVVNNIIAFNSSGVLYWDVVGAYPQVPNPPPALDHNCLYANGSSEYQYGDNEGLSNQAPGPGVVTGDPLFVDRTGGDYRLLPGSPCMDAGDDAAVALGETDLAGAPRIRGAHVDVGAYEWTPLLTLPDVVRALRIAGGLTAAGPGDPGRLSATGVITLADAARLARKASGLDPNP